jgi:hypothetical protein
MQTITVEGVDDSASNFLPNVFGASTVNKQKGESLITPYATTGERNPPTSFASLGEKTIIERYSGELEKQEDPRGKQASEYVPLDVDEIRKLLNTPWGVLVAIKGLGHVSTTLVEDGAENSKRARNP